MTINFDKYALTGKTFVKHLASELGNEDDTSRAGRVLRATLHVLRDQSSPEEAMQFISQLPMFIKAIFVDGWNPASNKGRVRRVEQFTMAVREKVGGDDFFGHEDCMEAVQSVIRVLGEYVSDGEMEDMIRTIPEGLRELFDENECLDS